MGRVARPRLPRPAAPPPPSAAHDPLEHEPIPSDAVDVAVIVGAWGVRGAVKLKPLSAHPQALLSCDRWVVRPPADRRRPDLASAAGDGAAVVLRARQARVQGDAVVAMLEGVADRDAADALVGARIAISRASFPRPEADEYYWVDLIGLEVVNRQALVLGTVSGLIETGPTCVLRVQPPRHDVAELMIPFVAAYVDDVDLPARRIRVDWEPDY